MSILGLGSPIRSINGGELEKVIRPRGQKEGYPAPVASRTTMSSVMSSVPIDCWRPTLHCLVVLTTLAGHPAAARIAP